MRMVLVSRALGAFVPSPAAVEQGAIDSIENATIKSVNWIFRNVLWVDCVAGAVMLALSGWLSSLYAVPREFVIGLGVVNWMYAPFSFSLAVRSRRPRRLVMLLVVANATGAVLCFLAAGGLATTASPFGLAHLIGEGVFVGGLARVEWTQRHLLAAD